MHCRESIGFAVYTLKNVLYFSKGIFGRAKFSQSYFLPPVILSECKFFSFILRAICCQSANITSQRTFGNGARDGKVWVGLRSLMKLSGFGLS